MKYNIYSGAGNDFVMINNFDNIIPENKQAELTVKICETHFKHIDGVIFIDKPLNKNASLRMNYYNRDGSFGAMCGNGARCTVKYAADNKMLSERSYMLEAVGILYSAELVSGDLAKIGFPTVSDYKLDVHVELGSDLSLTQLHWMNVGSEHIMVFTGDIMNPKVNSLDDIKINEWGSLLRFHESFQPKGANVNFVELIGNNNIKIRTYERGVEWETLACGTGIISSAITAGLLGLITPPVNVLVQSGETLIVDYKINGPVVENVSLLGSAKKISEGEIKFE
ncbi:MAG TPA: diaminopimelate epimerase [Ignavibacteria bacterium]|nr:diaminopimelate epimerase [Ignavibacteria bacterium]